MYNIGQDWLHVTPKKKIGNMHFIMYMYIYI